jgi:hypothetical protein
LEIRVRVQLNIIKGNQGEKKKRHLLESMTHRESKGLFLKEISARVNKDFHLEISSVEGEGRNSRHI